MIQMGTKLNVADNTGAKIVQCIKVLGGSKKMSAGIGDKIVVSIKKAAVSDKVKEGEVFHADDVPGHLRHIDHGGIPRSLRCRCRCLRPAG